MIAERRAYAAMFQQLHLGVLVVQCRGCLRVSPWRELAHLTGGGWTFHLTSSSVGTVLAWHCPECADR